MKFSWSTCARNRFWSKAIRRVRPRFVSLTESFQILNINHPDYDAILIGITEDHSEDYFEVVPNSERLFQTIVGFNPMIGTSKEDDDQIAAALFEQLSRAILACPLSSQDRELVSDMLTKWARSHL